MATVMLFHHALGRTDGILAFATALEVAGHEVIVPDLYDGQVFGSIDAGVAHAESLGFEALADRGAALATDIGPGLVVVGFSLGVLPAQKAAQSVPGVSGAVLCHSAVPVSFFGDTWPADVAVQLHMGSRDPFVEEDRDAIDELVDAARAELFEYDTSAHLVADVSSPDYDAVIAAQILSRILEFLAGRP